MGSEQGANQITEGDVDVNCQFQGEWVQGTAHPGLRVHRSQITNRNTLEPRFSPAALGRSGRRSVSGVVATAVTLTDAGSGYTGVPKCTISGEGGKGATCSAAVTRTLSVNSYQPAVGCEPRLDMATALGSVYGYNGVFNSAW